MSAKGYRYTGVALLRDRAAPVFFVPRFWPLELWQFCECAMLPDICIDCDGRGKYPVGDACISCGGSGRVLPGEGIQYDLRRKKPRA